MKPLMAIIVVVAALALGPVSASAKTPVESVTLDIAGMRCANCEMTIKGAVSSIAGVQSVEASTPDKVAVIFFDPAKTDPEQFIRAIAQAGYIAYVAKNNYRCAHCKVMYSNLGQCIICEKMLAPVGSGYRDGPEDLDVRS